MRIRAFSDERQSRLDMARGYCRERPHERDLGLAWRERPKAADDGGSGVEAEFSPGARRVVIRSVLIDPAELDSIWQRPQSFGSAVAEIEAPSRVRLEQDSV